MRLIKAILTSVLVCTVLLGWSKSASAQTKIVESSFSYNAPSGWKSQTIPGMKFKVVFGTPAQGFAPNINVVDESFPGSIEKYADANERTLQKSLPGYKKLSRAPFVTSNSVKGIKMVALQTQQGKTLRSTFYLFTSKSGPKLVVTCTSLASDGDKYNGTFDTAMKSFALK